MGEKAKGKHMLKVPKRPSSIPRSEISRAIKKVAAARRRKQESVSDGSK
jgi:hypothetical protein